MYERAGYRRMSEDEAVVHLEKPARGVREHARRLTRR
jgi:hypothetical protein